MQFVRTGLDLVSILYQYKTICPYCNTPIHKTSYDCIDVENFTCHSCKKEFVADIDYEVPDRPLPIQV